MSSSRISPVKSPAAFVPRWETGLIILLLGGLVAFHLRYAFVFRVDSDETQHLHVVWGWTQGQLPYRDFFDNHAPLFSWLCAPGLRALGERTDIVSQMRLATLPLVAVCLGCTYWLGAFHFGRRAAAWAVVLTGFFPVFFYTSSEVRPDTLWTALWLLAVTILVTGPATARRLFLFGVVFGLAFATSLKTVLLAGALLLAWLLTRLASGSPMTRASFWQGVRRALIVGAGLLLAPGAFAVFFALHGAWQPFLYCLIGHNVLPGMAAAEGWLRWRFLLCPLALPVLFLGARVVWRRPGFEADPWRHQRIILFLAAAGYPLLLASYWPLLTRQDYLPAIPLLAVALSGLLSAAPRRRWTSLLTIALILAEIITIFARHGPWRNRTGRERELLAATLRLTGPNDFVMDLKGETIFRRRPFYYALEGITRERVRRGLIADDIAPRLIATRTAVVHTTKAFPLLPAAQVFADHHYLSIGQLAVLGQVIEPLGPTAGGGSRRYRFEVPFTADYVVLDPASGGLAAGELDRSPPGAQGRRLEAGPHEFLSPAGEKLIVFWADAWRKGFQPLALSEIKSDSHG